MAVNWSYKRTCWSVFLVSNLHAFFFYSLTNTLFICTPPISSLGIFSNFHTQIVQLTHFTLSSCTLASGAGRLFVWLSTYSQFLGLILCVKSCNTSWRCQPWHYQILLRASHGIPDPAWCQPWPPQVYRLPWYCDSHPAYHQPWQLIQGTPLGHHWIDLLASCWLPTELFG